MKRSRPTYNERSWAIDLIANIKTLASQSNRSVRDAGGEQTINTEGGSLFPDLLLFGDRATTRILQGWELKMPDTSIHDTAFKHNAETKARALGLDSFLLWNVSYAKLYARDAESDTYKCVKEWDELSDITTRAAVPQNRKRWEALASNIIGHLNDLFDRGTLEGRRFIEAYRSGGVTALIMENAGDVMHALTDAANRDSILRNEITLWWERSRAEYAPGQRERVLAQVIISNWIGKILFAHILRERDTRAQRISTIADETSPAQALELFRQLSAECNFWTIFSNSIGLNSIPERVWNQIKQFNHLLNDLRVGAVDQAQLSEILEATAEVTTRKLRGQYPTPIELARFLVVLCLRNITTDRLIDPCCGSGTIARAALERKLTAGIDPIEAASTVYASDQDHQAVQIATFALANPALMHIPLRIFQHDAFQLRPNSTVEFTNPSDGTSFLETLGTFQAITSNLPFVAQSGRTQYKNALQQIHSSMLSGTRFTMRADVAAYLPFTLHSLLAPDGRLGIIITNAWLGTDWGDDFYMALSRYYNLKYVITSGAGRWFKNSDVVANVLVMNKKSDATIESSEVKFVVLKRPLEEFGGDEEIMAAQIELGRSHDDSMTIRSVSKDDMATYRRLGLGGNAQFVNCDWVLGVPLVALKTVFEIRRGERRGMNELFYPREDHGIEEEYLRPLAKSPMEFLRLTMSPTRKAFACSRTEAELRALGHVGALNWIRRFKERGVIKRLTRGDLHWYEMNTDNLADLVMFINYGDRVFVGRVSPPSFADQRLITLKPRAEIDIELHHALLNSAIQMFIIEGSGFGRGLGALDLNKDRVEKFMPMLDASRLDRLAIKHIKDAFHPLTQRDILPLPDEMEQLDRIEFDNAIIDGFKLNISRSEIYSALLSLFAIRRTVRA